MPQVPVKDSTVSSTVTPTYNDSHIFTGHELRPKSPGLIPRQLKVETWPAFVLMFVVVILVFLRVNNARIFFQVLRSFFSLGYTRQLVREEYRLNKSTSIALIVLFILTLSLFLTQLNTYYGFYNAESPALVTYLVICMLIFVVYLVKVLLNRALAFVINDTARIEEYQFSVFMMNKAIGVFLFPVVIGLYYTSGRSDYLLAVGIGIVAFFYGIRVFRGFSIGVANRGFSVFHLFLYLCSLELIPLIVFIKILLSRIYWSG